jgi:SNF2 family DNA or RNA helicase
MADLEPLWPSFEYKAHQISGIDWMLDREDADESGGLLCDEMGLGKTIEILGVIQNSIKQNTLLLCPKAVIAQWVSVCIKAKINALQFNEKKETWDFIQPARFFSGRPFLFITNYEKIVRRFSLVNRVWDRVVLDEAHKIANAKGTLYSSVKKIEYKTIWCVTATPIVNTLNDMKALIHLVGYKRDELNNYSRFVEIVKESCLHRSMEEMRSLLPELPRAAKISKVRLDFETEEEEEFYRGIQGNIMKMWKATPRDQQFVFIQLLMKLRQLSIHPQVYINGIKRKYGDYEREDFLEPSTKFISLKKKIESHMEGAKWIVFCQFHDEMKMLNEYLSESPAVWRVQQYHGGLTQKEKDEVIEKSHDEIEEFGKNDILLVQLHSGGVGLNLQHFTQVVFMSPWWTSALMDQAIGRAVRIGQTEQVEVTLFVLKEEDSLNIDEKMLEKAKEKKELLIAVFKNANKGNNFAELCSDMDSLENEIEDFYVESDDEGEDPK